MSFFADPCAARSAAPGVDVTTPLTDAERKVAFRETCLPLEERVFGLALVLGGTVSAGAYTAGVLDFLMEALDEWERARKTEDSKGIGERVVPRHKVELAIITGASGGGVCGGILSRSLGYVFPHVRRDPASATRNVPLLVKPPGTTVTCGLSDNPFWNVWVEKLRIEGLLGDANGGDGLLDATPIEQASECLAKFPGTTPPPPANRQWLHDDFNLVLGLTNLRGIPTKIDFNSGLTTVSQGFVERADWVRFGVAATPEQQTRRVVPRCDEMARLGPASPLADWESFVEYAKATGAFPGGFPARMLNRCITDYRFRAIVTPAPPRALPDGTISCGEVKQLPIDGSALLASGANLTSKFGFFAVDAGATDNAPVELARTHLSGLLGRNPRKSDEADRAVLLIDPFAEQAKICPPKKKGILGTLLDLIFGLVAESRYQTRDLMLAADNNVFSRFMLTASRSNPESPPNKLVGGKAICGSRMGAFFGFVNSDYSVHDYFLGRKNCQDFLQHVFVLPDTNPVLGIPNANQSGKLLQIIPLYGTANADDDQTEPVWPNYSEFSSKNLKAAIHKRLKVVLSGLTSGLGFWAKIVIFFLAPVGVIFKSVLLGLLATKLVDIMQNEKDRPPKL